MKVKNQYLKITIWVSINDQPYSIHSRYFLFFVTTIMGNTADLMVQKTIIVTLHKEGKSQRVITERGGPFLLILCDILIYWDTEFMGFHYL